MGSKKGEIKAYKIYMGAHLGICAGPVDSVKKIMVDGETAYSEVTESQQISIKKPDLFGGESSEGGVVGKVDLCFGEPTQPANDYLQTQHEIVPAYRGITCAILRQPYIGLNPFLKPWSFLVQRIHTSDRGKMQYYDEKSAILNKTVFGGSKCLYLTGSDADCSSVDYDDSAWKSGKGLLASRGWLSERETMISSSAFLWIRKKVIFNKENERDVHVSVTHDDKGEFWWNGDPVKLKKIDRYRSKAVISALRVKKENVCALFVENKLPTFANAIAGKIELHDGGEHFDMNPAHIIRECLTSKTWGMGVESHDIDDESFKKCADTLFDEGFGLSLKYANTGQIKDFLQEILTTIDAVLYIERKTGQYALKLIRDDYDIDDLVTIDETHIVTVNDFLRPQIDILINHLTLNYECPYTHKKHSLTVQNPALISQQGAIVAKTVNYSGLSNDKNALSVAERDLRALSYPFISCSIKCTRIIAETLMLGDCFMFDYKRYGVSNVVMRISEIDWGNTTDNTVTIRCAEDVFRKSEPIYSQPVSLSTKVDASDLVVENRLVADAPYYMLAQALGDKDAQETEEMDAHLFVAGTRPISSAINARILSDDSDVGTLEFCPGGITKTALGHLDTELEIAGKDIDELKVGEIIQIGKGDNQEIVRIDAISNNALTIARGCLDTVPNKHEIDAPWWAWLDLNGTDSETHLASEMLNIKLQTKAMGAGATDKAILPIDAVELSNRAFLPYPPANVTINGEYYPEKIEDDLILNWSTRNRLQQTSENFEKWTDGDITSEDGVTYNVQIFGESDTVIKSDTTSDNSYIYTLADEIAESGLTDGVSDPHYNDVVLLNHYDDGFVDKSSAPKITSTVGDVSIDANDGKFGGALKIKNKGYASVVPHSDFNLDGDFTIEFWFKLDEKQPLYNTLLSNNHEAWEDGCCYLIVYGGSVPNSAEKNSIGFGQYSEHGAVSSRTTINENQWYHIAISRKETSLKMFINGIAKSIRTSSRTYNFASGVSLGNAKWALDVAGFNGSIDDFRITKNVARYVENFPLPASPFPDNLASGVARANKKLTIKIKSERDGYASMQKFTHTVER